MLINLNKFRSYGLRFWGNPFEKDRGVCIDICNINSGMKTKGTQALFETRVTIK